jgi:hypothetical protein
MYCAACAHLLPADPTRTAPCPACRGEVLLDGRYAIVGVLGRGAAAVTWRLVDGDGGAYAGKELMLRADLASKVRELAHREASVLGQISHPQIPRLRESLVTGQGRARSLWIVQDLVPGQDLASVLAGRRLATREVAAIVASALVPLVYLHGLSPPVVHRDLKPGNLILRPDGPIALVDFGSVREAIADSALGGSTVTGTFGYMAPEQFAGDASPASDLYGLGATAIHLLTREPPHRFNPGPGWRRGLNLDPAGAALIDALRDPDPARRPSAQQALEGFQAWLQRSDAVARASGPRGAVSDAVARVSGPRGAPSDAVARVSGPRGAPSDAVARVSGPRGAPSDAVTRASGPRVAEVREQVWALNALPGQRASEPDLLTPPLPFAAPIRFRLRDLVGRGLRDALWPADPSERWGRAAWTGASWAVAVLIGVLVASAEGARDPRAASAWSGGVSTLGASLPSWLSAAPPAGPFGAHAEALGDAALARVASSSPGEGPPSPTVLVAERARHLAPADAISVLERRLHTAPDAELAAAVVWLSAAAGPPRGADATRVVRWAGLAVPASGGRERAGLYEVWLEAYLATCPTAPAVAPDGPCGRLGADLRASWRRAPATEASFPRDPARCERVLPSDACRP